MLRVRCKVCEVQTRDTKQRRFKTLTTTPQLIESVQYSFGKKEYFQVL